MCKVLTDHCDRLAEQYVSVSVEEHEGEIFITCYNHWRSAVTREEMKEGLFPVKEYRLLDNGILKLVWP